MTHEYERRRDNAKPGSKLQPDTAVPGRMSRSAALRRPEHPVPSALAQRDQRATTVPNGVNGRAVRTSDRYEAALAPIDVSRKVGGEAFYSPRFMGDSTLEAVVNGGATLKLGDGGISISRLQTALADLGYEVSRSGMFDDTTAAGLKRFQLSKSLVASGILDKATLIALDAAFAGNSRDAAIAMSSRPTTKPTEGVEYAHGAAPAELLAGTSRLTSAQAAEAIDVLAAIQTIDKTTGETLVFDEEGVLNGRAPYREILTALVNLIIDHLFSMLAKDKGKLHADPESLHSLDDVANVGQASKARTDAVFGAYAVGPAFDTSRNLRDRWATEDARIKDLTARSEVPGISGTAAAAELAGIARWRVQKIINDHSAVEQLNADYGAVVSRNGERQVIEAVITEIASKRKMELLEIQRGWPGAADPDTGEVFMQLFKVGDATKNRRFMWNTFQMLIHEYLHILNHSRYCEYTDKLTDRDCARGHTLREGVTDYLTRTVLATVNYRDELLRQQVEGPYHEPGVAEEPPAYHGYSQAVEAEQVVGVVGARNMYAAYFLGEIELLGGSL